MSYYPRSTMFKTSDERMIISHNDNMPLQPLKKKNYCNNYIYELFYPIQ